MSEVGIRGRCWRKEQLGVSTQVTSQHLATWRDCLTGTVRSRRFRKDRLARSRARECCLCLRLMFAGEPRCSPPPQALSSFPLCLSRCSVTPSAYVRQPYPIVRSIDSKAGISRNGHQPSRLTIRSFSIVLNERVITDDKSGDSPRR